MIENLFGVVHATSHKFLGVETGESKVHPSRDLIREILSHPPGTKVGLEYSPRFNRPHSIDKRKTAIPPEQRFYWQFLRDVCRSAGHEIVYLEDFPTYQEYCRKAFELDAMIRKLQQSTTEEKESDLYARSYGLQVEVDYIWIVKRETAILKLIQSKKPNIVILGKGHTEYLTQNPQELANMGITINRYQTESVPSLSPSLLDFYPRITTSAILDEVITPNPDVLIERACLERRYKVVTEGRVTDGSPDFIGTWDTDIPTRGLFEIYSQKDRNTFGGTIEDCIGSAIFNGSSNENQISFTKFYIPSGSLDVAFKGAISYHGTREGNSYRGRFEYIHSEHERSPGGEFTLQRT